MLPGLSSRSQMLPAAEPGRCILFNAKLQIKIEYVGFVFHNLKYACLFGIDDKIFLLFVPDNYVDIILLYDYLCVYNSCFVRMFTKEID